MVRIMPAVPLVPMITMGTQMRLSTSMILGQVHGSPMYSGP